MPRLLQNSGTSAGREFRLVCGETNLGRSRDNDVSLDDPSVSRFHARIFERESRFYICDLDSTSGTYVNGDRIARDHPLNHGDTIRLGTTELILDLGAAEAGSLLFEGISRASEPARVKEERGLPGQMVSPSTLLPEDSIVMSLPTAISPSGKGLSDPRFHLLTRVAEAIQSTFDLDELLGTLMDLLFDIFHPDRGAILLCETPGATMVQKIRRPDEGELPISSTIVDHAARHRMSLVVADTSKDERFRGAASVVGSKIQAAICSPLVRKDQVLGVIYLDTQMNLLSYEKEDLTLLNIIAANAAVSIENAILVREKLDAHRLSEDEPGPIIAQSEAMRKVEVDITRLGPERSPLLITGATGTGKLFAAKAIYRSSGRPDTPFVVLDCSTLASEEALATLFGDEPDDRSSIPPTTREPADRVTGGALKVADSGTLVLRHIGALEIAAQKALARYLSTIGPDDRVSPGVRIIATTSEALDHLVHEGRLDADLRERLSANILMMPRAMDRKEDILPLVRYFLEKCDQRSHEYPQRLNKSAERALMTHRYKERNVSELREVVEFAAFVSDGIEIGAEHIFGGPTERDSRLEIDLSRSPLIRWLLEKDITGVAQSLMLLFFIALVVVCLTAGETVLGWAANAMVWGLWWPALVVLFLVVGRVWCTVCPISKVGRVVQRLWRFDQPPPQWIKERTAWLMPLLFIGIIWSEHVFHMIDRPAATGLLLIGLMAISAILCVIFSREVWCRYLCPLGCLGAGYSVPAMVQIHANRHICSTQCRTHDCFKGSETDGGCPMYHHPLYLRDAHFCKLCMHCLRVCPHGSARPYIRWHLQDIWRLGDLSETLVPFSLVVFFLTPVMLAAGNGIGGIDRTVPFTVASLAALALGLVLSPALPVILSRERDPTVASRVGLALLLLAWGPFFSFHMQNIPGIDALRLGLEGSGWENILPFVEVSFLSVIQVIVILLSGLLAAVTLWRIWASMMKEDINPVSWRWTFLVAFCALYLGVAVGLILTGPNVS